MMPNDFRNAGKATRPLNVLWLIDHVCYDGSLHGGGRLFMNLVPQVDSRQVRIFPYFLRASAEVQKVFKDAPVKVENLNKGKYDLSSLMAINRLCKEHRIDVMHLFCYASSTFGRMVGRLRNTPTVIHDFDTQVYFPYPPYLKIMDRLLAPGTAYAFAASSFCRDYMRDVRRLRHDRIEVMFHAIPERQLELARNLSRAQARAKLGWPEQRLVYCAITKLGPERGNETMIRAFAKLRARVPDARLVIVYKPTLYHRVPREYEGIPWIRSAAAMRAHLQETIDASECAAAIELVESLDSPELYYAASDVMLAPFENKRFSSVNLIEAMAYGRPHVVTAIGEPGEIAATWRCGLTVPPGDPDALAAAALRLAEDRALLSALSQRARAAAVHFTTPAVAERLANVYAALAAGHAPAALGNLAEDRK
jgi:glycosyltransferase involved in cell wall biosynthesis